jgi:hypothetical protein
MKEQFDSEKKEKDFKMEPSYNNLSTKLNEGLQTASNAVDYLLHGSNEEDEEREKKKVFHSLAIEQHHILLVMFCLLAFVIFWAYKNSIPDIPKQIIQVEKSVEQPAVSSDNPSTWIVTQPIQVNPSNVPSKLLKQVNILYPDINSNDFRWFRTQKGWNVFYDVQKAKMKFTIEGYWLETEEREFPIEKIPEYLLARIKMSYSDYTLLSCEREIITSGNYYELTLKRNRPDNINEEFTVYLNEKANNYANLYEGSSY